MKIPKHVAVIMDGNGRWARCRGLSRVKGHEAGAESVRAVVRGCRELGVEVLTLYGFSTENWKRPTDEVAALMGLLKNYLESERKELLKHGIKFRAIGQLSRLPSYVRVPIRALMRESVGHDGMVLNLALSYGSRAEIVEAVQELAVEASLGRLNPVEIDESLISSRLSTGGLPDPDLIIRTSGENRWSNFLLWQSAYAEFYVTDVPWPDFRREQLEAAIASFSNRERRFGKTGAQLGEDLDV